jgi:hypothetical protein
MSVPFMSSFLTVNLQPDGHRGAAGDAKPNEYEEVGQAKH